MPHDNEAVRACFDRTAGSYDRAMAPTERGRRAAVR